MSHNWKNILINPDQSLYDALQIIDQESLRIALVVNDKHELLGVVTDGDIRRGLIKKIDLQAPVKQVMNTTPITATVSTTRKDLVKLMQKEQLLAVPLIDNNQLVGLETLQQSGKSLKYQNPVFLMAGGFGARLKPLTDNCPKPLLKIGGTPILEIILKRFVDAGFVNFYISTHYMPELIQAHFGNGSKWGITITYVHEETPLGTGGALGLLPKNTPEHPLFLINGDILTTVDFEKILAFHTQQNAVATMCVRDYEYQIPFGVINGENHRILNMEEKPIHRFFINTGIYVVNPEIWQTVKQNTHINMPTLLEQCIEAKKNISMYPIRDYWLDIGRIEDFHKAQTDIVSLEL